MDSRLTQDSMQGSESGDEVQIDDVARHAGVGVGTVYRHFPTKQALVTELVRQTFRLFTERAREALGADEEPFALIEADAPHRGDGRRGRRGSVRARDQ
jgi:AcrR family transcriptional regulator